MKQLMCVKVGFFSRRPTDDKTDSTSLKFPNWRFSLRNSNTESLLRLNAEPCVDIQWVKGRTIEIET